MDAKPPHPLPAGYEIETVLSPDDAKDGPFKFLGELSSTDAQEMRDELVRVLSIRPAHFASNLGVIELCLASAYNGPMKFEVKASTPCLSINSRTLSLDCFFSAESASAVE